MAVVAARAFRAESSEGEVESELGEVEELLGWLDVHSNTRRGQGTRPAREGVPWRMAATSSGTCSPHGHFPEHVAVPKWARWVSILGHFWAKFGQGLNSKVGAHTELYNFH
jgi:hypothetical protein